MAKKHIGHFAVTMLMLCFCIQGSESLASEKDKIPENVYIGDTKVGGMTYDEALEACAGEKKAFGELKVSFRLGDVYVNTDMKELGYSTDLEEVAEEAVMLGKKGNVLKRYKDSKDYSVGGKRMDYTITPYFEASDSANVENKLYSFNKDAVAASITQNSENGFDIVPEINGIEVDMAETINNLSEALRDGWDKDVVIDVVYNEIIPEMNEDTLSQIKDVLGSYTTYYQGDSGRMKNVETATAFINGTLLMPGETLDVDAMIRPYTEENGYAMAAEYSGGKVVQGMGGGICQVSTTLYNTVLYAELEVIQRYPHSMTVGYVDLSRDAAISGDVKDFVFKNNQDTPVYVAGSCAGGYLTFSIYGKDTRPANRTIEFESRLIETIEPDEPVETFDETLPPGTRNVTSKARKGYVAQLWKHVYIDGELVESIQINSSSYMSAPEYVTVGPAEEEAEATEEPVDTEAPQDTETTETTP